jgi:hypothetical protein
MYLLLLLPPLLLLPLLLLLLLLLLGVGVLLPAGVSIAAYVTLSGSLHMQAVKMGRMSVLNHCLVETLQEACTVGRKARSCHVMFAQFQCLHNSSSNPLQHTYQQTLVQPPAVRSRPSSAASGQLSHVGPAHHQSSCGYRQGQHTQAHTVAGNLKGSTRVEISNCDSQQ